MSDTIKAGTLLRIADPCGHPFDGKMLMLAYELTGGEGRTAEGKPDFSGCGIRVFLVELANGSTMAVEWEKWPTLKEIDHALWRYWDTLGVEVVERPYTIPVVPPRKGRRK